MLANAGSFGGMGHSTTEQAAAIAAASAAVVGQDQSHSQKRNHSNSIINNLTRANSISQQTMTPGGAAAAALGTSMLSNQSPMQVTGPEFWAEKFGMDIDANIQGLSTIGDDILNGLNFDNGIGGTDGNDANDVEGDATGQNTQRGLPINSATNNAGERKPSGQAASAWDELMNQSIDTGEGGSPGEGSAPTGSAATASGGRSNTNTNPWNSTGGSSATSASVPLHEQLQQVNLQQNMQHTTNVNAFGHSAPPPSHHNPLLSALPKTAAGTSSSMSTLAPSFGYNHGNNVSAVDQHNMTVEAAVAEASAWHAASQHQQQQQQYGQWPGAHAQHQQLSLNALVQPTNMNMGNNLGGPIGKGKQLQ